MRIAQVAVPCTVPPVGYGGPDPHSPPVIPSCYRYKSVTLQADSLSRRETVSHWNDDGTYDCDDATACRLSAAKRGTCRYRCWQTSCPWPPAAAYYRAGHPLAGAARAGVRSIRLAGPRLDEPAGGRGDPAHHRRHVSPRPCQPLAARPAAQQPAAGRAGHTARRGGHPGLVARALARSRTERPPEGVPLSG
jgi:hypothetical protein